MSTSYPYNEHGILLGKHTMEEREAWIQAHMDRYEGDRTKRRKYSSGRRTTGESMSPHRTMRLRSVLKWNRKVRRELQHDDHVPTQ